jgi:hypothetical protein
MRPVRLSRFPHGLRDYRWRLYVIVHIGKPITNGSVLARLSQLGCVFDFFRGADFKKPQ